MTTAPATPAKPARFVDAFTSLSRLPLAFWLVVGAFVVESMAYFGILTLMTTYVPANTPQPELETGTMWFIYGCIAMIYSVGLALARKWVMAGFHPKSPCSP
jgi:hypothetical protein